MVKGFRHKGLQTFFETGKKSGVSPEHAKRLRQILTVLNAAKEQKDIAGLPGLHHLAGSYAGYWAVSVSGNWRVIFKFDQGVTDIDYLDYY